MSPLSRVARRHNLDRCSNGLCVCRCSVPEGRVSLVISPRTKEKRGRQPTRCTPFVCVSMQRPRGEGWPSHHPCMQRRFFFRITTNPKLR